MNTKPLLFACFCILARSVEASSLTEARVTKIILPRLNQRDMEEVPKELMGEIKFIFVDNVLEVFREALKDAVVPPSTPPRPKPLTQPAPSTSH